jgi:hypothetical protein
LCASPPVRLSLPLYGAQKVPNVEIVPTDTKVLVSVLQSHYSHFMSTLDRPSRYFRDLCVPAHNDGLVGATDDGLAEFLGVSLAADWRITSGNCANPGDGWPNRVPRQTSGWGGKVGKVGNLILRCTPWVRQQHCRQFGHPSPARLAWNEGSLKRGQDRAWDQRSPQSSYCAAWCAKTPDHPPSVAAAAVGGVLAPYGAQKLGRDAGLGGNCRKPSWGCRELPPLIGITLAEIAETPSSVP